MSDKIIKGYKATDENMQCRGFQFELGKWYEHKGDLDMCESGFHFCEYPSGPWCYYWLEGTRVFRCEAKEVVKGDGPGADLKHVAKFIRLVEEITVGGDRNTGYRNTGDRNTGSWNTGDRNTGNRNTGDSNTGSWNTGDSNTGDINTGYRNTGDRNTGSWNTGNRNTGSWNTGDRNTGNRNTGDSNTGNRNTGNRNTGNRNTGDSNTGDSNTGDSNTGNWNTGNGCVGDFHTGIFCKEPIKKLSFDLPYNGNCSEYQVSRLAKALASDESFEPDEGMLSVPNATKARIKALHKAHIKARKKQKHQRGRRRS